ncbi:Poly-beta-1,6-N-acetyl-D-glucosamine N-deacetylase [Fusobacterium necrophorum subsp. funduliforme]|uniref:polysaccharide deacetylase family protein n=1 Tax=Fusobacterium necrophorum TaxID=859 RepID=UPI001B8AE081|nr:polysaccharide deacetylase family protein [Fusobacterium necrophorum]MBR8722494.1 Poly-beta-1,6-N-acetyl-D-glucosamine N-deacetylase [Fusobacterium necrophorum subsp. funduliforme]
MKKQKIEVPILMYHQFKEDMNHVGNSIATYVTRKQFEWHLRTLKFLGYETITFRDLEKIGLENRFKKRYIILTVDDGYQDNYEILFPLLKKYQMKAVIYLVSDSYNRWDVEEYGVDKNPMMKEEQVREMIESGLVEFGGHTLHHCDFHVVNEETAKREILENKKELEEKYRISLSSFAYPYGHVTETAKKIVKEAGYRFAVSTSTGTGIITDDLYEMRRTSIDRTSVWRFLKRISGRYSVYKGKKWMRQQQK